MFRAAPSVCCEPFHDVMSHVVFLSTLHLSIFSRLWHVRFIRLRLHCDKFASSLDLNHQLPTFNTNTHKSKPATDSPTLLRHRSDRKEKSLISWRRKS